MTSSVHNAIPSRLISILALTAEAGRPWARISKETLGSLRHDYRRGA
jgi:hypothetical protein